jgi:hypothetical protein
VKRAFAGPAFARVVAGTSGRRDAIRTLSDFLKNASTSQFPQGVAGDRFMTHNYNPWVRLAAATISEGAKIRVEDRRFQTEMRS